MLAASVTPLLPITYMKEWLVEPSKARTPKTAFERPSRSGGSRPPRSSGSYSRSASMIAETSPRACSSAVRTAAPLPMLRSCVNSRTGFGHSRPRSISRVPSVDPSSTTISSKSASIFASRTSAMARSAVPISLKTGIRMDSSRASGTAIIRSRRRRRADPIPPLTGGASPRLRPMPLSPVQGTTPRVALVHDFLLDLRGAERVFLAMCELWPEADIFTAVYDPDGTEGRFEGRNVHTSFLQRLRPTSRTFRGLLPLYPAAIEPFDLSEDDLVVSSSSAWAHAVICDVDTVHVSYCHNPFRYAWNDRDRTLAERVDPVSRVALRHLFRRWRQWDWIAAPRGGRSLANSPPTQRRIHSYWGRESTVVYPPVDTHRFAPASNPGASSLVLSERMRHKRIAVAVQAFNKLRLPLTVAGDGPESRRLRRMAGPTIKFTGRVSDAEAARLFATCRALVVPSVEEFGIVAVEAQAAGRPVLAVQAGGTCETVVDGVTGRFWTGDSDALADAVLSFDPDSIDPAACVENAEHFARAAFAEALPREVAEALADAGQADGIGRRTARVSARPRLGLGRRLG